MTKEERIALYDAREPARLELLIKARAGDRDAAAELLKEYGGFIGALMRRTGAARILGCDDARQIGSLAVLATVLEYDPAKELPLWVWMWRRIRYALYRAVKEQCHGGCRLLEEIVATPLPHEPTKAEIAAREEFLKLHPIYQRLLNAYFAFEGSGAQAEDWDFLHRAFPDCGWVKKCLLEDLHWKLWRKVRRGPRPKKRDFFRRSEMLHDVAEQVAHRHPRFRTIRSYMSDDGDLSNLADAILALLARYGPLKSEAISGELGIDHHGSSEFYAVLRKLHDEGRIVKDFRHVYELAETNTTALATLSPS